MFGRKKQDEKISQLMLDNLETSNANSALLVSTMKQIMAQNTLNSASEEELEDMDPDKAAYALNLCTVSVSQIIDYADLVVLEREYDAILNNLNLENIPKDEALLKILKEILDTVTFFRIQAGDRKMIEKEHQEKMKDAIWSAVPSFGLIVAGGNIWTALVSIASQVGIGYMNYRKTKTANAMEYDKQMWQLQRAAIEQLNGLRRELFDTSWRLANKYKFKEEKRLTERQISQYNEILIDANCLRKYERLESISKFFDAYPPYWYNLGHAANMVYQEALSNEKYAIADRFLQYAKDAYEQYRKRNKYRLLREDRINSACALEYIDLLDVNDDRDKISQLLKSAVETSGRACDVLQLCALVYLRIGEIKPAKEWLKYLVNEGYNDVTNAQLLSYIYAQEYLTTSNDSVITDYNLLSTRVYPELLFPMPELNDDVDALTELFEKNQKIYLLKKYALVVERVMARYNIKFNQCIPAPVEEKGYAEDFYSDTHENRKERLNQYLILFNRDQDKEVISERLASKNIFFEWINLFNEMLNNIEKLLVKSGNGTDYVNKVMLSLVDIIENKFEKNKEEFSSLQDKMNTSFESTDFERLMNFSFEYFTHDIFAALTSEIYQSIYRLKNMSAITTTEISLKEYCKKNNYPDPDVLLGLIINRSEEETDRIYLSSDLLGGSAFEKAEESKLVKEMAKCVNEKIQDAIIGDTSRTYPVMKFGVGKHLYRDTFRKKKYIQNYGSIIVGAVVDKSIVKANVVFTTKGLLLEGPFINLQAQPEIVEYSKIAFENNYLNVDGKAYKNNNLNLNIIYDIIQNLNLLANAKEKSSSNPLLKETTLPLIEMIDNNIVDMAIVNSFEMEVLTRIYKSDGVIKSYGKILVGSYISPGTKIEIYRSGQKIGEADVLKFDFDSTGQKKYGTIWIHNVTAEIMRGDCIVVSP